MSKLRNVISYSVYGESPKYLVGMVRNIELAAQLYPNWYVAVYCDHNAYNFLSPYSNLHHTSLILHDDDHWCPRMMARFLIADDPTVERFIVRDADSRLSKREVEAVQQWINEGTRGHVMRDHPAHAQPMMGGLWGIRFSENDFPCKQWMGNAIRDYLASYPENSQFRPYKTNDYADDQNFLHKFIWPYIQHSCTQHDSVSRHAYPGSKPFPSPRPDFPRFVGEVWCVDDDGSECPRNGDWETLRSEE